MSVENAILRLVRNGTDLTSRQMGVLFLTGKGEALTVRALAEQLNISKPAISRATDRLETYGFVARKADPGDRRSVLIEITRGGDRFLKSLEG